MPMIKKWGNSLGVRIPTHFANQLDFRENMVVEFSIVEGGLVVKPTNLKRKYSLCEMLQGITEENLHKEIDTGDPKGAEIW